MSWAAELRMLRAFLRSASVWVLSVISETIAGCRNRCHEISGSLDTCCSLTKSAHLDIAYLTLMRPIRLTLLICWFNDQELSLPTRALDLETLLAADFRLRGLMDA